MNFPLRTCVKADSLRHLPQPYDNLREYLADPKNGLVCRRGIIWITDKKTGKKEAFNWRQSLWANPFKVKESAEDHREGYYTLDEALENYSAHLDKLLENGENKKEFAKLLHFNRLGCFCNAGDRCHVDIILSKLSKL